MPRLASRSLTIVVSLALICIFSRGAGARSHKDHWQRKSAVYIPVSLAVGSVRTPKFQVVSEWYDIMVRVEKPLPFQQMTCMMGVVGGPLDLKYCSIDDPLLRADWTVWDSDRVVDKGTIPNRCACIFTNDSIFKFLGSFPGEVGKTYVVEVRFTKDGTALDIANPQLIIIQHGKN